MGSSGKPENPIRHQGTSSSVTTSRRGGPTNYELTFFIIVAVFACLSIALNAIDAMHSTGEGEMGAHNAMMHHPKLVHPALSRMRKKKMKMLGLKIKNNAPQGKDTVTFIAGGETTKSVEISNPSDSGNNNSRQQSQSHSLGGLKCAAYGGPPDEIVAKEMVYWSDIPSDSTYVSPFKRENDEHNRPTQYMTFEPDGGGWNNIRMAMETVVVMAHAMGRTLVLPPAQGMYLLRKDRGSQNTDFSFADFFHLESLSKEHSGIDIISAEQFLNDVAMTGKLKNKTTGLVQFPPGNRTNWDGQDLKEYKNYMREVIYTPLWSPGNCLVAFPESGGLKDVTDLHDMHQDIMKNKHNGNMYDDNPTPVDASAKERMQESLAHRKKLCIYDEEMQQQQVLHFMCYHKMRVRLLTHFYTFLYFEDWKQQLWEHRFVRDHLRYLDELHCAAGRVVVELRKIATKDMKDNPNGEFDSLHVRRGDFQYKDTRLEADELLKRSEDVLHSESVLYIATDERKKEFFEPFKKHYKVYFLDDFKHLFEGLNTNYYGMLDQLIASRGKTFVGTFHSTFTGYINRMRGYHAEKDKLEGYELGKIDSYYFTPDSKKHDMRKYKAIKGPFFAREFPMSWRDIDKGISDLH